MIDPDFPEWNDVPGAPYTFPERPLHPGGGFYVEFGGTVIPEPSTFIIWSLLAVFAISLARLLGQPEAPLVEYEAKLVVPRRPEPCAAVNARALRDAYREKSISIQPGGCRISQ